MGPHFCKQDMAVGMVLGMTEASPKGDTAGWEVDRLWSQSGKAGSPSSWTWGLGVAIYWQAPCAGSELGCVGLGLEFTVSRWERWG